METWIQIEDFPNYEVSNHGRVRNRTGKVLKQHYHSNYLGVGLSKGGKIHTKDTHRLVAISFLPNPDGKPQVNHKDGNKDNNHSSNFEWVTAAETIAITDTR
jgi:hypothetical protein